MSVWKTVSMTVCVAAACAAPPAQAGTGGAPAGPVRIANAFLGRLVQQAFEGAARRLDEPGCRQVLHEFRDEDGRSLAENLAGLGDSGAAFMDRLLIYEARGHKRCASGNVLAVTTPGSRVVLICGDAFRSASLKNPRLAEAVLIHEALHGLGLGENPPTSQEITTRVLQRCHR
jgi:hypothetical protein